ncbi:hypothetical protein EDD22DRAFT_951853 [Suillus occidentalis]|nr:hypothetical protein EDD22DRAFT_951853 [Suillus occidentalis]
MGHPAEYCCKSQTSRAGDAALAAPDLSPLAILGGHTNYVNAITLSWNNRLLASASDDSTARLWNLDTNLPVAPPLQHQDWVESAAFSANGRVLVAGSKDKNAYAWDVNAILKQAGLEDLLLTDTNITPKDTLEQKASQGEPGIQHTPRSSLSDKSFLQADATRCHDEFRGVDELSPRFFDGMDSVNDDSSPTGGAHPHFSASALFVRLASLLRSFRPDNADANELSQTPMLSGLYPRVLFTRLSSLIHRSPPQNDASNELQQPSTPSRIHLHALLARISSLSPHSQLNTEETELRTVTPSRSRPDTNEEIELSQCAMRPHVIDVAPMRDREVLFVAERTQADRPHHQSSGTPHSRPIRLLGHIGLFLCCACNHQHADGHRQPTQQPQGQSQGQVQAQVSSSETQPATPSASAIADALVTHTTVPGANA